MLVSNSCSWNIFWKEDQRICSWNLKKYKCSSSSLLIHKRSFCRILSTNVWTKYLSGHFRENWQKAFVSIVCIGVSSPPSKTTPLFFTKPPLKSAICLSPPILGNSPLYIGFSWAVLKNRIFQGIPIILRFFIPGPIPSFKGN